MKKYILLLIAAFSLSIECATVRIQNNWDKGVAARINEQTKKVSQAGDPYAGAYLPTPTMKVPLWKDIAKGDRKFFDSGLYPIKKVTFTFKESQNVGGKDGFNRSRTNTIIVHPDIGALRVERRIFFNNPTDIRLGEKTLKIESKIGKWSDWSFKQTQKMVEEYKKGKRQYRLRWVPEEENYIAILQSVVDYFLATKNKENEAYQNMITVLQDKKYRGSIKAISEFDKQLRRAKARVVKLVFIDNEMKKRQQKTLAAIDQELKTIQK